MLLKNVRTGERFYNIGFSYGDSRAKQVSAFASRNSSAETKRRARGHKSAALVQQFVQRIARAGGRTCSSPTRRDDRAAGEIKR